MLDDTHNYPIHFTFALAQMKVDSTLWPTLKEAWMSSYVIKKRFSNNSAWKSTNI